MPKSPANKPQEPAAPAWQTAKVTLPRVGGFAPTFYVTVLYAAAAVFLVLWIFLIPGLAWPGARVTVVSVPPGAAVFFGERAYGYTPTEVFVPAGQTDMVLTRPHFPEYRRGVEIPNQPILSWLFPARMEVRVTLQPGDPAELLAAFEATLSEIALAAPFEENRQPPPLFTDLRNDLAACGLTDRDIQAALTRFAPYLTDAYLYRDLRMALSGSAPGSFQDELAFWEEVFPSAPFLSLWVYANLPLAEQYSLAQASFWEEARSRLDPRGARRPPLPSPTPGFWELPLGDWIHGPRALAEPPRTEPFLLPYRRVGPRVTIQRRPVTQREFAAFLRDDPTWSPANRQNLIREGRADERYLSDWTTNEGPAPDSPVVNVSAYAAEAYADYLSRVRRQRVRLPFEDEWEAVAGSNPGLFEWMGNAYRSAEFLLWQDSGFTKAGPGVVRSVRSNVNRSLGVRDPYQRGALPPEFCSPNLGFRVVIEAQ